MFQAVALQVGLEFPVHMVGQGLALPGQVVHQDGVVRFDEPVEQRLFRLMAFVGGFTKAFPAVCQHACPIPELTWIERTSLCSFAGKGHVRMGRCVRRE